MYIMDKPTKYFCTHCIRVLEKCNVKGVNHIHDCDKKNINDEYNVIMINTSYHLMPPFLLKA